MAECSCSCSPACFAPTRTPLLAPPPPVSPSHPPPSSDSPRDVDKSCDEALPAPIKRIFYMSAGGWWQRGVRVWEWVARLFGVSGGGEDGLRAWRHACLPCARHVRALPPRPPRRAATAPHAAEGDTHEHEVAPAPNPRVLAEVRRADAVIFGMGSLYTSIFPSLILKVR